MALTDKLTAIADAIRAKTGKSDALTLDEMPIEIGALGEVIPEYMQTEADRVAALVQSVRTGNSLTFAALSDMHLKADDTAAYSHYACTKKSADMAAKTLIAINKQTHIDANILLGDYTYAAGSYTAAAAIRDFVLAKEYCADLEAAPCAWLIGNHEINYGAGRDRTTTDDELYAYLGANSIGLVRDPDYPERNYGYIDFPNQRIRMICLNTADALAENPAVSGSQAFSEGMSSDQLRWFADAALDLSDKSNAAKWGIVICSHHPLNSNAHTNRALTILEAYKDSTSGTISYTLNGKTYTVPYDFTAGAKADIICNIHGHSHNFKYEQIGTSTAWLWRLCMPCINSGRENECATYSDTAFAQKWGEFNASGSPVYYKKAVWSDAENGWVYDKNNGTSYCIVTIDRTNSKIYAHYVGTGINRTVEYDSTASGGAVEPDAPTYTNLVPTATSEPGGTAVYNGVGYTDGKYVSSGNSYGNDGTTTATGYIAYPMTKNAAPSIYVKGIDIRITNNSHCRLYFEKAAGGTLDTNFIAAGNVHYTIEMLDEASLYFRIDPVMVGDVVSSYNNWGYSFTHFRISGIGSGADLIITLDEPID